MPKQTAKQTKPDAVAAAEATLAGFEKQKAALVDKQAMLAERRRVASYEAHAQGDVKLIDGLTEEAVRLDHRIASLNDAIAEAERRLHQAQDRAAREADRVQAQALLGSLDRFVCAGTTLDGAAETFVTAAAEMRAASDELHAGGITHPTFEQIDVIGHQAVLTMLSHTPWARRHEHPAPNQRKTFAELTTAWAQMIERAITSRLGDNEDTEAA
jgi:hypothetical protein